MKSAFKKTALIGLFFTGCLLMLGCKKDKEPLAVYSPNDTYFFDGARLNQQGDTLQQYSMKLTIPETGDSTKTFSVGINSDGGVSHNITWHLTDKQTGQKFISQKKVAKSDRKVTLNMPDTGPLAFTSRILPLVADLDMGKKSFVKVAGSQQANKNGQPTDFNSYTATLTYPGDTVVFLPDSIRVVCKHYNAVSESGKQKITSKFLFNKDLGFVRMEYVLPKNERLVFKLVPTFPEVKTKEEEKKKN